MIRRNIDDELAGILDVDSGSEGEMLEVDLAYAADEDNVDATQMLGWSLDSAHLTQQYLIGRTAAKLFRLAPQLKLDIFTAILRLNVVEPLLVTPDNDDIVRVSRLLDMAPDLLIQTLKKVTEWLTEKMGYDLPTIFLEDDANGIVHTTLFCFKMLILCKREWCLVGFSGGDVEQVYLSLMKDSRLPANLTPFTRGSARQLREVMLLHNVSIYVDGLFKADLTAISSLSERNYSNANISAVSSYWNLGVFVGSQVLQYYLAPRLFDLIVDYFFGVDMSQGPDPVNIEGLFGILLKTGGYLGKIFNVMVTLQLLFSCFFRAYRRRQETIRPKERVAEHERQYRDKRSCRKTHDKFLERHNTILRAFRAKGTLFASASNVSMPAPRKTLPFVIFGKEKLPPEKMYPYDVVIECQM